MTTTPARPIPVPDEASAPYFEGANAGRLMLMRCPNGHWRFPARDRCDVCWSTETEWLAASGRGTLYSWVVFHQIYHPAFAERVPYPVAVVELAEGPRMTADLVGTEGVELRAGMPLEVTFERRSEEIALPRFRPADG